MPWNIILFETARGESPVEEFIKTCQAKTRAKISSETDLLEKYGNLLGRPHIAPVEKGIFELRVRGREEIRIFYCFIKKDIYLLHAFKKKTQRIPQREIELARKRLRLLHI